MEAKVRINKKIKESNLLGKKTTKISLIYKIKNYYFEGQ